MFYIVLYSRHSVPATLASELEDLLRGVTAKQTQELNAPILTSALTCYAENTNLLVVCTHHVRSFNFQDSSNYKRCFVGY